MPSGSRTKTAAIALAALLVASALGYWAYGEHRKRELHNAVVSLVKDTSARLREALSIEAGPPSADPPETVRKLDDHAKEVDRLLQELHRMNAAPDQALVDAADDYVLTGREILRKQASSHRYRLLLSDSTQALLDHMRADDRSGSWVREAVRAKERFEKDYRDYKLAVEAFGSLLESFPASRAKLAAHVDAALLLEEGLVREARKRALETSKQTADEIEKTRRLASAR